MGVLHRRALCVLGVNTEVHIGRCGVHAQVGTCVFIQIYGSPASGRVLLGFIGVASAQAKPLLLCG